MTTTPKPDYFVGLFVFFAGILLGTLLAGGLIWSDIEAVFYGLPHLTNHTFGGLDCPPLMTRSETANLLVTARNDTDRSISPLIRVEISAPGPISSIREKTPVIPPGERVTLEFPVSKENIDLGFFIFAKAFRYPDYQIGLAEDTCGILVLDVPFAAGSVFLAFWLGLSILSILAGLWLLEKNEAFFVRKANILTAFRAISIILLIGILLAIQGNWIAGIALLVVMLIFNVVVILNFLFAH